MTAGSLFWNRWVCRFGVPEFLTSDGGAAFSAAMFGKLLEYCGTIQHVSCANHPEGHGAVERANYVVTQVLRAFIAKEENWPRMLAPVEFAMNTAVSRSTGLTPFEIVHGCRARLTLHVAAGLPGNRVAEVSDEDPIGFAKESQRYITQLCAQAAATEQKVYADALKRIKRKAPPKDAYTIGDYVLIAKKRVDKLGRKWKGPAQVTAVEGPYIFVIKNLLTNSESRIHANRLRRFVVGSLSQAELEELALAENEELVDGVLDHRVRVDGKPELLCQVRGTKLPYWKPLADCRFAPRVKEYCVAHGIDRRAV